MLAFLRSIIGAKMANFDEAKNAKQRFNGLHKHTGLAVGAFIREIDVLRPEDLKLIRRLQVLLGTKGV